MIAARLPGGRLHLQHGPIDCICRADGDAAEVEAAYAQATIAFRSTLPDLCRELALLRAPLPSARPAGRCGTRMHDAVAALEIDFVTPMAAVAGAVADDMLEALIGGRRLRRAFVNNGGDVAVHLAPGETLAIAVVTDVTAPARDATVALTRSGGVATSGRACKGQGGRSFSLGIADAVTILARDAATADAAATAVANAVDLPGHPAVARQPARALDPDSDLGARLVTTGLGPLDAAAIDAALQSGANAAHALLARGLIEGALLALRGRIMTVGPGREPDAACGGVGGVNGGWLVRT